MKVEESTVTTIEYYVPNIVKVKRGGSGLWEISINFYDTLAAPKNAARKLRELADSLIAIAVKLEGVK